MRSTVITFMAVGLIFFSGCSDSDDSDSSPSTPSTTKVKVSSDWYVISAAVTVNGSGSATYLGNGEYELDGAYSGTIEVTGGVNDVNGNELPDTGESYAPILSAPDGYVNVNPFTTMLVNGMSTADLGLKYPVSYSVNEMFDFDVVAEAANDFDLQKEVADASVELSDN